MLFAQEMKYLGRGKILFENDIIKNPRKIKEILIKSKSAELMNKYHNYVLKKRFSQVFSAIGGFGIIYSVEDEFVRKPKVNWYYLTVGIGSSLLAEVFSKASNKKLEELTEIYNDLQLYKRSNIKRIPEFQNRY